MSRALIATILSGAMLFSSPTARGQAEAIGSFLAEVAKEAVVSLLVEGGKSLIVYTYNSVTGEKEVDVPKTDDRLAELQVLLSRLDQNHQAQAAQIGHIRDQLRGKASVEDLRNLDSRISGMVAVVDSKLTRSVDVLRKQINERTTKEDVERIVRQTLDHLKDRLDDFDMKFARLESDVQKARYEIFERLGEAERKVNKFRDQFGFISDIPPAPLLFPALDPRVKPPVTPLMATWAGLLVRSEQNRLDLARLRQRFEDRAAPVKGAIQQEQAILRETAALHARVNAEFERLREEYLRLQDEGHKLTSAEVQNVAVRLLPVTWLKMATRPSLLAENRGRLMIPEDFIGPSCSDILEAFELSGANLTQFGPIFRQLLAVEPPSPIEIARTNIAPLARPLAKVRYEARLLLGEAAGAQPAAQDDHRRLEELLKIQTEKADEVVKLKMRRQQWCSWLESSHSRADSLLNEAIQHFIRSLKTERMTSPNLIEFRRGILLPLSRYVELTDCADWSKDAYRAESFVRFIKNSCPTVATAYPWYNGGIKMPRGKIYAVAVSPDGNRLAVGGDGTTTALINFATGGKINGILDVSETTYALAFSPNGRQLASGSAESGVRIWDVASRTKLATLNEGIAVSSLAYSPDGRVLAVGGGMAEVGLYDTRSWVQITTLNTDTSVVNTVTFSRSGAKLAIGGSRVSANSMSGSSQIWDIPTARLEQAWKNGASTPRSMFYTPTGDTVISAYGDGLISFLTPGANPASVSIRNPETLSVMAVSPDGKLFAVGGNGSSVCLWDLNLRKLLATMRSDPNDGSIYSLAFAPDGLTLVSGSSKSRVRIWDIAERREANSPP